MGERALADSGAPRTFESLDAGNGNMAMYTDIATAENTKFVHGSLICGKAPSELFVAVLCFFDECYGLYEDFSKIRLSCEGT